MEPVGLLIFTLLPAAFWFWLFARRDVHPEPAWLLWRTFAYGALSWALAAALELSVTVVASGVLMMLLVAFVEESVKLLAASTATRDREFDEPIDGLIYAVTASLGFAFVENIAYGLQYGLEVAAYRGLVTTLAHALFSAPLGYALAGARFATGRWWRTRGLVIAVTLHVTFNGLLTGGAGWEQLLALVGVLALMYALAGRLYARLEVQRKR
ncbi:PrsW family intramembrane metalloprotease [Deinococcus yavapaiensis]|uniref:Protease PrsW n=1 Tax=Deinococcus yavapaiensis KR-236 TaxID=694435 RepID=A0A318S7F1_9DEIO|nr:PrsW family intramembrane metalloprotease [Deinococcus yavapaiensis]PYE54261.1 RsiW-degrading membrane proteinase PrsW (M82 family) [Deinococcus yavapaiensis KR-236]